MPKSKFPDINKLHLGKKKPQHAMSAAFKLNGVLVLVVVGPSLGDTALTGAALAIARGVVTAGSNEGPVHIGTEFLANQCTTRLPLYIDSEWRGTLPMTISDLAEIANRGLTALGKRLLIWDWHAI